mmetsp:Transcript_4688/g.11885  ORF Transcript_4688/g.11885 Transcript_4688/m.11885 type:complete len:83 (+) Transcript_4688:243-491(+)
MGQVSSSTKKALLDVRSVPFLFFLGGVFFFSFFHSAVGGAMAAVPPRSIILHRLPLRGGVPGLAPISPYATSFCFLSEGFRI